MNKTLQRVVALVCVLVMILALSSCDTEHEHKEEYFTVTFNTNGGSKIDPVEIKHGKTLPAQAPPVRENYIFCYWECGGNLWKFDVMHVKNNMTLDAIWIAADELFELNTVDGGIEIVGIKKQLGFDVLSIPSTINGKTVVGLSEEALMGIHDGHADAIIFPSTLTYVKKGALKEISVVGLSFSGPLSSVGESAFENCTTLKSITLAGGMTSIPFLAFAGCSALSTVNIPEGVLTVEENAFDACTALLTVVLPKSLVAIENGAFDGCTSLKTVFFAGNEQEFDKVEIALANDALRDATVYFYSEQKPSTENTHWHYNEKNVPVIW